LVGNSVAGFIYTLFFKGNNMAMIEMYQIKSLEYKITEIMNKLNVIEDRIKDLEIYIKSDGKIKKYFDDNEIPAFLRYQAE
jgi:hypothetical protein